MNRQTTLLVAVLLSLIAGGGRTLRAQEIVGNFEADAGEIVTVAGGKSIRGPVKARQAALLGLCAVEAHNKEPVVYITESQLHQIFRLNPDTGVMEPFAGTEFGGFNGDGKPALETEFQVPCEMAIHPKTGDLYVVDTNNYRIRAIAKDGSTVKTVAGIGITGTPEPRLPTTPPVGTGLSFGGFSGDGSSPTKAELNLPAGVAFDAQGNFYISDSANNRVRVVNTTGRSITVAGVEVASGTIQTIAGTGDAGYSGDGGNATDAKLAHPREIKLDSKGNVVFVDSLNEALRRIDRETGIIETLVQTKSEIVVPRTGLLFPPSIDGLAIDAEDNIYYSNLNSHAIFILPPEQETGRLIAGVGVRGLTIEDGPATRIPVSGPGNLAVGRKGEIYVVEVGANVVRRIVEGRIRTVAGGGAAGEGVPATEAMFSALGPVAVSPRGDLFIGDFNLRSIRRVVAATGIVETFAGQLAVGSTRQADDYRITRHALATTFLFDGARRVFITDGGTSVVRLFTLNRKGWEVSRFAGNGTMGISGNGGPALEAELSLPQGLAQDADKDVYISGIFHPMIRVVDREMMINAFAGTGISGSAGNGRPARQAQFNWPTSMAFDSKGNLYVVDFFNNTIRVIRPDGIIEPFAGTGERGYSGDGGPAREAEFDGPVDLRIDRRGNIIVSDANNHVVRFIEAEEPHVVRTIVGTGERGFSGDGGPALEARLNTPRGIALSPDDSVLYIADALNRRVRAVALP